MQFVAQVDWIVPTTGEREVMDVDPETVTLPPYAVDTFEPANHANAIRQTSRGGFADRFPVVSPADGELSLVEGQFALWLAREAHLEEVSVMLESLSKWRQAVRFAFDHLPLPRDSDEDNGQQRGFYTWAAVEQALELYIDTFGEDAFDIYPVRATAEKLGITNNL